MFLVASIIPTPLCKTTVSTQFAYVLFAAALRFRVLAAFFAEAERSAAERAAAEALQLTCLIECCSISEY